MKRFGRLLVFVATAMVVIAGRSQALPDVRCAFFQDTVVYLCAAPKAFCRLNDIEGQCDDRDLVCRCKLTYVGLQGVSAQPAGCTTVGSQVAANFVVLNQSTAALTQVLLTPSPYQTLPSDSCRIAGSTSGSWPSQTNTVMSGPGGAVFTAPSPAAYLQPGQSLTGTIMLGEPGCCYAVLVEDTLGNEYQVTTLCFTCGGATSNLRPSWGRLRLRYR